MHLSPTANVANRRWFDSAPVRAIAAVVAFTGLGIYEAIHLVALTDKDIWWHLRTGLWILQNHAIPTTGLFSQSASFAWIDSSWGFDLLTGAAYRFFGLAGLPVLLLLFQAAIAIAMFRLARTIGGNFRLALVLSGLAQFCVFPLHPRPGLCSMVLLAAEIALLVRSRRSGNARTLLWLPLIFLLWGNVDRQFSYGLVILALFSIAVLARQVFSRSGAIFSQDGLTGGALGLAVAGSLLATFITPYGYRLHALVWQSAMNSAADRYFHELHAMRFRQPQDYLILLMTMTAFFALGRRRSRDCFLYALLIVSAVISFRLQRDTWLVVVAAVAVIADMAKTNEGVDTTVKERRRGKLEIPALVILVFAMIGLCRVPAPTLMSKVAENFPVRACDYIRQNHLLPPLFNTYQWGGFLTWYLPEYPVSIDGRADLYGDEINIGYFRMVQAEIPLQSYASFVRGNTFLLESNSPLTQALSTLPDFRVAYQDEQATVVVRGN